MMDRIERALARAAADYGVNALLLVRHEAVSRKNVQYLTGFTGSSAYVLVGGLAGPAGRLFLTDGRYVEQAGAQCAGAGFEVIQHGPDFVRDLAAAVGRLGIKRLGFESDAVLHSVVEQVRAGVAGIELVATDGIVARERMVKDAVEIAALRRAAAAATVAFENVLGFIRPGVTEREIAMELERQMRAAGAEALAFDMIVASGPRSSMQHGAPSGKAVQAGEFVLMDFGAMVDGYLSDMTRTVVVGRASDEQRKVYDAVRLAQEHGLRSVKPGVVGGDVWRQMWQVIADAGYGEFAGRRFGHALGLEIHEAPYLIEGSRDVLTEGNVVTVEPGAYIPGWGGVRIEDQVIVTADGCEAINGGTKELVELT